MTAPHHPPLPFPWYTVGPMYPPPPTFPCAFPSYSWLSCLPLPLASHSRLPCLPLSLLLQPSVPSPAPPTSCLACPPCRPSSPCPVPLSPPGPLCCHPFLFSPSCSPWRPAAALPPSPCPSLTPPVARPSGCPPLPPLLRPACPSSPRGPPVVGRYAPPLSPPVVVCSPPLPFPPSSPATKWFLALATEPAGDGAGAPCAPAPRTAPSADGAPPSLPPPAQLR